MEKDKSIIIFDGDCVLCNRFAAFIVSKDKNRHFEFVPNTSELGIQFLERRNLSVMSKKSIILEESNICYYRGSAVRKILIKLPKWKYLGYFLYIIPLFLLNTFYTVISRIRKKLLRNNYCALD